MDSFFIFAFVLILVVEYLYNHFKENNEHSNNPIPVLSKQRVNIKMHMPVNCLNPRPCTILYQIKTRDCFKSIIHMTYHFIPFLVQKRGVLEDRYI